MSEKKPSFIEALQSLGQTSAELAPDLIKAIEARDFKAAHEALKNNPEELNEGFLDGLEFSHPLRFACQLGHFEMADFLLEMGADINSQEDVNKKTMLMHALKYADYETESRTIAWIFKHKDRLNINLRDESGSTALDFAVSYADTGLMNELIAMGADVNVVNCDGETALFTAIRYRKRATDLQSLVNAGANIHHKNKEGETVLEVAEFLGEAVYQENIDFLQSVLLASSESKALDEVTSKAIGEAKADFFRQVKSL